MLFAFQLRAVFSDTLSNKKCLFIKQKIKNTFSSTFCRRRQRHSEAVPKKCLKTQKIQKTYKKYNNTQNTKKYKKILDPGRSRNPTLAQKSRFGDVFLTIGVAVGAVALRIGPEASPSQGEATFDASRAAQK